MLNNVSQIDDLISIRENRLENNHGTIVNKFKFVVTPVVFEKKGVVDASNVIKKKYAIIELKHIKSGMVTVHRFSNFILLWKSHGYNTMRNKAYTICRFLNFIINNNDSYKLNSFSDLDIHQGVDYLTELTLKGAEVSYFFTERETLDKFYLYLSKKKLLNNINMDNFEINYVKRKRRSKNMFKSYKTLFDDALQPSNVRNEANLHNMREEFIAPFLETAIEVCPRIALGIFFQMWGGLRKSEVLNISITGISFDNWGIKGVKVSLYEEIISDTYKHTYQACIKKNRTQDVLNFGDYLQRLLKMHLVEKSYFAKDGTNALFSNSKGNLLSPQMYDYYFNKVKKAFIDKLMKSPNKEIRHYGMFLKMSKWSTHIGRGIASNFVADSTESEYRLAQFRGDSDLSSSIVYIEDTSKYKESIYVSGNSMYEKGLEMIDKLNATGSFNKENG